MINLNNITDKNISIVYEFKETLNNKYHFYLNFSSESKLNTI